MSATRAKYFRLFFTVLVIISAIPNINLKDYEGVRFIGIRNDENFNKNKTYDHSVCIGTTGRMSVPNNREHHYRNLRDRYTNCTYVDGNLELTWLQDENLDLDFLKDIREVTGYVLISHVDVTRIVLPSLQIVRGRTLFKLSRDEDEYALIVTLSKMHNLEMPALRDILSGSVGILNNYNLCHIKTIEWKNEIITSPTAKYRFEYKFHEPERDCTPCHESCTKGCWGPGPQNCQKFSKISCSPQCHGGRCFGPKPRECCHLFCAGGCTGPKQSDCLACKNFYDDGVCKQECPPMQRYNPVKYKWERNPDGKYAYGATCVKDCPKHLLKDNGACVRSCPPKKKNQNGECVPCDGPCPKTCEFSDIVHAGNIGKLQNCTIIEGSLTILDSSFDGFQQIYDNFTFGARIPAMDPTKLEVFSTLKEVTGFLNIQANHTKFTTLNAFRNLETIGGRHKTEYFSSLYIVKTSLTSLGLRSLRKISSGGVAILENADLCYVKDIKWSKIMRSQNHNFAVDNNKNPKVCKIEDQICDAQCSSDGCWGAGRDLCLSCSSFQVGQECVESCDPNLGLYRAYGLTLGANMNDKQCMKCDKECELTCRGAGPHNCDKCKHATLNTPQGPLCVAQCPEGKYDDPLLGQCADCHANCLNGCNGPENSLGENGCKSCNKAIIDSAEEVVRCLKEDEPCPDGYFYEWVVPEVQGKLKPLEGKTICRPCHPLCKRCTGYGFHKDVCQECLHFEQAEQCTNECSADHYPASPDPTSSLTRLISKNSHGTQCLSCNPECKGCYGPSSVECNSCVNFKVFLDGTDQYSSFEDAKFNCTNVCPELLPHKHYDGTYGPFCSEVPEGTPLINTPSVTEITLGILGCIILIGIFGVACFCQWRRRAIAKENTAKMTMVMTGYDDNEPLRLTNIKPNLAKLKIVKEAELRRGGILGGGAFGTVYKGVWVPEGENVKIPVAVKVLHEGTSTTANNEILEEAHIMASVDHPNLLQLLALCMTGQMMLVTQLMPLGCLLDYVRNNKDKIGSKPLLNWCTQIARGMTYLEEKRLVHRDLAARNVLVQTPSCVKITDFGLAKILDTNVDEYKATGGKMPIKWLALECIQHRTFTHKSDVWAFGVTVWELLTYGARPYENTNARDVPDLLEKGERLPQPSMCTIDLYMILVKCWQVNAESRPEFKELAEQFAKMARDPARYLVVPGDKLMRLPSYTTQDERELIRNLAANMGGSEAVIVADEYLNPGRIPSNHTLNTPVDTPCLPSTPTQKFFPHNMPPPSYHDSMVHINNGIPQQNLNQNGLPVSMNTMQPNHHQPATLHNRHSRYGGSTTGINDGFSTLGNRSLRNTFFSTSCDPLKLLEDDMCDNGISSMPDGSTIQSENIAQGYRLHMAPGSSVISGLNSNVHPRPPVTVAGLKLDLPLDDEDYLMPSPQSPMFQQSIKGSSTTRTNGHTGTGARISPPVNTYMDLISDIPTNVNSNGPLSSAASVKSSSANMFQYPPPQDYFLTDAPSNYGRVPDFTSKGSRTSGNAPIGQAPSAGGFFSMDNPEYILNEQQRSNSRHPQTGNYHTLGIPFVNSNSPSSHSQGPSSIHSVHSHTNSLSGAINGSSNINPSSLSSNASSNSATISGKVQKTSYNIPNSNYHSAPISGLNGAVIKSPIHPARTNAQNYSLNDKAKHRGEILSSDQSDEHEYYNDYELRLKREMQPLQKPQQNKSSTNAVTTISVNLPNNTPGAGSSAGNSVRTTSVSSSNGSNSSVSANTINNNNSVHPIPNGNTKLGQISGSNTQQNMPALQPVSKHETTV